jgi:hypothetical protein
MVSSLVTTVVPGLAAGNYSYNELPTGSFERAALNNKGQVAGKTTVDGVGYLTLWLPQTDYGLQAGAHTFPIPKNIPGTYNTQTLNEIEFADNGTVFIWKDRTTYLAFYQGQFSALYGIDFPDRSDLFGGINMASNGMIYAYPLPLYQMTQVGEQYTYLRTGPAHGREVFYGATRIAERSAAEVYSEEYGIGRGNRFQRHVAGLTTELQTRKETGWETERTRFRGWFDGSYHWVDLPGEGDGGFADINDKNQMVSTSFSSGSDTYSYVYLPSGDYGIGSGLHRIDTDMAFNRITGNGELFRRTRFDTDTDTLFYSLEDGALLDANDLVELEEGAAFTRIHDINDQGLILAEVRNADGTIGLAMLKRGFLDLELSLFDVEGDQARIENNQVELGQRATARLLVTAKSELEANLLDVAFTDELGLLIPEQFQIVDAPESLEIGDMAPGDTVAFEWTLRAVKSGYFTFESSNVQGVFNGDPFEEPGANLEGEVPGLLVEIVLPEEPLQLIEKEQGDDLSEDPGYEPLEFPVVIRVSVPENGEPLKNITLQGFDASDGGVDIDLVEKTGLVDPVVADVLEQPVPFPVSIETRSTIGMYAGPVEPGGDPVEFTVIVKATKPGLYDFASLITASPEDGGRTITARGNAVKELLGDILLTVQLEIMNPGSRIFEGEAVEISGVVENITLDETVELDPVLLVNMGQGIPKGPVGLDDPLPEAGQPGIFNPTLPPQDEGKRAPFRVRIQTVSLPGIDQRELGRPSVVVDFAIGGKVIDKDGNERDLKPENVAVEWGNGRHSVSGATFLRAEVQPDPMPIRVLDPDTFFTIAAGNSLEKLVEGGGEALIGIGQFLGFIPEGFIGLANVAGQVHVEKQIASQNVARYMWAWVDYQTDLWLGLESETHRQQLQLISDELIYYYGPKFDTAEEIAQLANDGIRDYLGLVIDYRERAYDSASYGYNEELAKIVAEPFKPIGQLATEEAVAAAAIAAWIGRYSRSPEVLEEFAESRRAAQQEAKEIAEEATEEVARRGEPGDPRATFYQDPKKAIPRSTPVSQKQAVEGWGVDTVSDENLIRMTDVDNGGMSIFVAIRSRADETLEWMQTKLGITPKPMTFKPKNVNHIDVEWLGYRKGVGYGDANGGVAGDRGATLLAEPIPREEVLRRLNARGASEKVRKDVLERHDLRWEEWYGQPWPSTTLDPEKSKFLELSRGLKWEVQNGRKIGAGTLDVPRRGTVPQPDDNFDTTGPGVLEARKFELRQVNDPPDDHLFPAGRQYFECWLEDDLGEIYLKDGVQQRVEDGVMRRIAGDIDIVSVGYADGSALTPGKAADTIAANLLHAIYAQHPWTTSFTVEKLFKKFLNDHRWHPTIEERGEPLLIYVNGERRVGWFHPTRAIDAQNPLQGMVWLEGGTADVDNVVRFQQDLRGLPDPYETNPPSVEPVTSSIRKALIAADAENSSQLVATCTVRTSPGAGRLFRLGQNEEVEVRDDQGNWSVVDPTTECQTGGILTLPETFLASGAKAGDNRIPIIESLLGFDWREMFAIGKEVLVGAGTEQERIHTVVDHGSLILEPRLEFDYPPGTRIVALPDPGAEPIEPFAIEEVWQEVLPGGQARINVRFTSFFLKTLVLESSTNLVDWEPVDPVELLGATFAGDAIRIGNPGEPANMAIVINPADSDRLFFRLRPGQYQL